MVEDASHRYQPLQVAAPLLSTREAAGTHLTSANSYNHHRGDPVSEFLCLKSGRPVGLNEHGEVAFRTPSMTRGYYKRPRETAELIDADSWCPHG
ncbi:hypothetical protein MRX96_010948 [Rhipicephalus microplus]